MKVVPTLAIATGLRLDLRESFGTLAGVRMFRSETGVDQGLEDILQDTPQREFWLLYAAKIMLPRTFEITMQQRYDSSRHHLLQQVRNCIPPLSPCET